MQNECVKGVSLPYCWALDAVRLVLSEHELWSREYWLLFDFAGTLQLNSKLSSFLFMVSVSAKLRLPAVGKENTSYTLNKIKVALWKLSFSNSIEKHFTEPLPLSSFYYYYYY